MKDLIRINDYTIRKQSDGTYTARKNTYVKSFKNLIKAVKWAVKQK